MNEVESTKRTTVRTSVFAQLRRSSSLLGIGLAVGCVIGFGVFGAGTEEDFVRFGYGLLIFGAGAVVGMLATWLHYR